MIFKLNFQNISQCALLMQNQIIPILPKLLTHNRLENLIELAEKIYDS